MLPTRPIVLVVEDDPLASELLCTVLERAGYTVETAMDGAAALTCIEAGGLDLVLLDLMLPKVDGYEVCRRVRARDAEDYLPIIMCTALDQPSQRRAGFAAGADDYVTKPIQRDDLLDRVQVWVRARERLKAAHERLRREQEALRESECLRLLARLDGVGLTARTVAHLLNNDLVLPVVALELLRKQPEVLGELRPLVEEAAARLDTVARRIATLQQVVEVTTQETPAGPLLDIERSVQAARSRR